MLKVDFFFTYKYTLRFLIASKLGFCYNNSYKIPFLHRLYFFFSLVKSVDKHDVSYYIIFIFFIFFLANVHFYQNISLNLA